MKQTRRTFLKSAPAVAAVSAVLPERAAAKDPLTPAIIDDLAAYYAFDGNLDAVAGGKKLDATFHGEDAPTFGEDPEGRPNKALVLDGVDDYVSFARHKAFTVPVGEVRTFMLDFKPMHRPGVDAEGKPHYAQEGGLLSWFKEEPGYDARWRMEYRPQVVDPKNPKLGGLVLVEYNDGKGADQFLWSDNITKKGVRAPTADALEARFAPHVWHNVAVTIDRTNLEKQTLQIFHDGVATTDAHRIVAAGELHDIKTQPVLGAHGGFYNHKTLAYETKAHFKGGVDNLFIFKGPKKPDQLLEIISYGRS